MKDDKQNDKQDAPGDWEGVDGTCQALLLGLQPQFAGHCVREKLDGRDWRYLLGKQPRFAERRPADKRPEGTGGTGCANPAELRKTC